MKPGCFGTYDYFGGTFFFAYSEASGRPIDQKFMQIKNILLNLVGCLDSELL